MITLASSILLNAALAAGSADAMASKKISTGGNLFVEGCQFADAYAHSDVGCEVSFSNNGDRAIKVFDFSGAVVPGTAEPAELVVPPHANGYLRIKLNVRNSAGASRYPFKFRTDEQGHDQGSVSVRGFVLSEFDDVKPTIDFGVVDSDEPARRSMSPKSREEPGFRITKILDAPAWLEASVLADGRSLELATKRNAPWGLQNGFLKLAVDTKKQKELWVAVKADVHGEVIPSSNPIDMGLMRVGNRNEHMLRLNSQSGRNFSVQNIELDGFKGNAQAIPCKPAKSGCKMIRVRISDRQPTGAVSGKIWITVPEYKERFAVSTWGLLVPKDFKVHTLDAAAAEGGASSPSSSASTTPSLIGELNKLGQPSSAEAAPPSGTGPLLKWTVAQAVRVYGFQIFRSEAEGGQEVLVNPDVIHNDTLGNEAVTYQWRDTSAASGKTYWYSIRTVNNDGTMEQLVTPHKVLAK